MAIDTDFVDALAEFDDLSFKSVARMVNGE